MNQGGTRDRRRQRPGRALGRSDGEPGWQRVVRRQRPGDDRAGVGRHTYTTLTDNGTVSFAAGDTVSLYATTATTASTGRRSSSATAGCSRPPAPPSTPPARPASATPTSPSTPAGTSRPATAPSPSATSTWPTASCQRGRPVRQRLRLAALHPGHRRAVPGQQPAVPGIDIQADTIVSGQTLALNTIGTQTTTNLRYVFPGGLTVNQGGSVTVAASVPVVLSGGLTVNQGGSVSFGASDPVTIGPASAANTYTTLTDNGTVSFAAGDTVGLTLDNGNHGFYGAQIVVGNGGLLQATGTTFNSPGSARRQLHLHHRQRRRAPPGQHQHLRRRLCRPRRRRRVQRGRPDRQRLRLAAVHPRHRRAVPGQQPAVPDDRHPGGHDRQRPDAGAELHRHADHDQPPLRVPRRSHRQSGGERDRRRQRPGRALGRSDGEPGGQRVVRRQRPGDDRAGVGRQHVHDADRQRHGELRRRATRWACTARTTATTVTTGPRSSSATAGCSRPPAPPSTPPARPASATPTSPSTPAATSSPLRGRSALGMCICIPARPTLCSPTFSTRRSRSTAGPFISITGNDFSNGTVVASGTSTATIDLLNNYWGTTNTTNIAAKITDHVNELQSSDRALHSLLDRATGSPWHDPGCGLQRRQRQRRAGQRRARRGGHRRLHRRQR